MHVAYRYMYNIGDLNKDDPQARIYFAGLVHTDVMRVNRITLFSCLFAYPIRHLLFPFVYPTCGGPFFNTMDILSVILPRIK